MKSIIVSGLESSCTRYVSKLLALNLIGHNTWNGQKEISNNEYSITHFSLPEGSRSNFGDLEYFESFDVVVICIRDFYSSLVSKNNVHQYDQQKAFEEHLYGKQILQDIYGRLKNKVVLYSYETAFILGEKYNADFVSKISDRDFYNLMIEDINIKNTKNIPEEPLAKKIIRLCNETACNCVPWKISNKPIHLPPIDELTVSAVDPQPFVSIGVKSCKINTTKSHLIVCDNIIDFEFIDSKTLECSKICHIAKISDRMKDINLFRHYGYGLINEETYKDHLIMIFRPPRVFEKEIWNGQKGTVLVHSDVGFGDDLYSLRYSSLFKDNKVIFESRLELKSFMEMSKKYDQVITKGDMLPDHDYQISNKCLDEKFKDVCCLECVDMEKSNIKFKTKKLKIGLVYQGNKVKYEKRRQYDPYEIIKNFEDLHDDIQFYSLQEKSENLPRSIIDMSSFMNDWLDVARYVQAMDCIITPDTAVVHLAALLSKPTFVMLDISHTNFWISHPNETSPFYPETIKAFWGESAFERIKYDLKRHLLTNVRKNFI